MMDRKRDVKDPEIRIKKISKFTLQQSRNKYLDPFFVMKPCGLVDGDQRLGGTYCPKIEISTSS